MYRLTWLLLVLFFSSVVSAQGYRLYGDVIGQAKNPVTGASVELLRENTVEKRTATTDIQGRFFIDNVQKGKYLLRVSSMNYTTYLAAITVEGDLNIGTINIADTAYGMTEVKITGSITPLHQSNDTTTYDARAYKSFEDADAYYLLSKMPGFKMSDNKVTVDDDSVSKLLLNGELLFNGDIIRGLKSIPASGVEKVATYNDKSDKENLTGFKETANSKVIDIKTKEGFKMPAGKAYAGAGDKGAYALGLSLNKVADGEQISVQGTSNNVSYRPMSLPDPEQRNAASGINQKTDASVNYSKTLGKNVTAGFSYSYYRNARSENKSTTLQYLLPEGEGRVYNTETYLNSLSQDHRAMGNINWKIDSLTTLRLRTDINYRNGNNRTSNNIISDNFSNTNLQTGTDKWPGITNSLSFTHGFRKKGRSIDIRIGQGYHTSATEQILSGNTYTSVATSIDQRKVKETIGSGYSGTITYTEPIGKWNLLELSYSGSNGTDRINQQAADYSIAEDAYTLVNDSFSNILNGSSSRHDVHIQHKYQKNKITASVGIAGQLMQLKGVQSLPVNFNVNRTFNYLLPDASFQYAISNTRSVKLSYYTSINPFKVTSLANVVDNSDPVQYKAGNPSLKPEYNHYWRSSYQSANNAKGTRFSYGLSAIYRLSRQTDRVLIPTKDTMIFGTRILKGTKVIVPVNLGDYRYLSNRVSYSTPLQLIKCNLKSDADFFVSRGSMMNNNETGTSTATGGSLTMELSSNISQQIDFTLSSSTTFRSTTYSLAAFTNDRFFQQVYGLFAHYNFWKTYYLGTQASFLYAHSSSVDIYNRMNLVDLSLGTKVLDKKGDIKFVAHDIFNQNKKVEHNNSPGYIEDIRTIGIKRYFMLMFSYSF